MREKLKEIFNSKYELELMKKIINRKDIYNIVISIFGILIANIGLFDIARIYQINYRFILYDVLLCLIIVFINIYSIRNKIELVKTRDKLKIAEEVNKNLSEITDKLRSFKHDFNNIIQALDGYIYLEDLNSLQVYFSALLKECNYVNGLDFLTNREIDNPAIYGILISKYRIAEKNNIKMNIDVLANMSKLKEKSYVVSRMLGILLDNALEATKDCKEKIVNVQFLKEEESNKKMIVVENTYSNKDVDTKKIFEKDYTTKKAQGNSGLGLWKINDILSKDSSFDLCTSKNDEMFRQELKIYL